MKQQINSFKVAIKGILFAIKQESHLRFHIIASIYVIIFANFYNMTKEKWAVLLIVIGFVISAELFNSSIEELCDSQIEGYDPMAKATKDIAAGAVLISAIVAFIIGVLFFWQPSVFKQIYLFFKSNIALFILLLISIVFSIIFVKLGPLGIKEKIKKLKIK